MTSRTNSCAPKPTAKPKMPAPAMSGATLTPTCMSSSMPTSTQIAIRPAFCTMPSKVSARFACSRSTCAGSPGRTMSARAASCRQLMARSLSPTTASNKMTAMAGIAVMAQATVLWRMATQNTGVSQLDRLSIPLPLQSPRGLIESSARNPPRAGKSGRHADDESLAAQRRGFWALVSEAGAFERRCLTHCDRRSRQSSRLVRFRHEISRSPAAR